MSVSGEVDSSVCLVHLVRQLNGAEPLRKFLSALQQCSGDLAHDLLLLCKGFDGLRLPSEYLAALSGWDYRTLFLSDEGFDIVPYFAAVRETEYDFYCFLNSFSEPLDRAWLRKLNDCLRLPRVGLVGATASWGSVLSHMHLQYQWSSAYSGLFDRFAPQLPPLIGGGYLRESLRSVKRRVHGFFDLRAPRRQFAPFPAPHIRTNVFMLRRETMLKIRHGAILTKLDAMRFESGRDSLTAQVLASGESALLVGRDGIGYHKEDWARSDTFWQADQQNLLVADNQTLSYERGGPELRHFYARYAWGEQARDGVAAGL